MYTRIVECHLIPGTKDEMLSKLMKEVTPVLQSQPGFVDMIGLTDENDPDRLLAISLWQSKEDAERYHRDHFQMVADIIAPALKRSPTVQTFTVNTSTAHHIAAGKAA